MVVNYSYCAPTLTSKQSYQPTINESPRREREGLRHLLLPRLDLYLCSHSGASISPQGLRLEQVFGIGVPVAQPSAPALPSIASLPRLQISVQARTRVPTRRPSQLGGPASSGPSPCVLLQPAANSTALLVLQTLHFSSSYGQPGTDPLSSALRVPPVVAADFSSECCRSWHLLQSRRSNLR